jgi:aldehyde dehydrogenase (NAD+)
MNAAQQAAPPDVLHDRGAVLMHVGADRLPAAAGEWIEVTAPSRDGARLAQVPRGRAPDVDRAVAAARAALPGWRGLPFTRRQQALLACSAELAEHAEELARLTAAETGNALRPQARPEAQTLVSLFRYFAGAAAEVKGVVLPAGDDQLQYTRRQPVGVVGAILPWNSPLMIAGMKIPAALAAGNTIVVKAAEDAPLAVLRLAELCAPHLPPGVLNVITGYGPECGAPLSAHPGVGKVSFTGSTAVGRTVGQAAGERLVPASLELGGKSPTIVWPDAATPGRLDETADGILSGRDEQVIALANDSHYGLAAYLWCHDMDRALRAADRIEAGWVQVNQGGGQVVGQSYGGVKGSGLGREFSVEGMPEAFTTIKQVNVRLSPP